MVGHACKLDLNRPSPADPLVRSMAEAAPRGARLDVRLLDYIAVVLLPRVCDVSEVVAAWLNERWRGLVAGAEARWDRLRPWRVGAPAPFALRGTGAARFAAAALWLAREDGPPRWLVELAEFVWRAEVAPEVRRQQEIARPSTVSLAAWSQLVKVATTVHALEPATAALPGQLLDANGALIATSTFRREDYASTLDPVTIDALIASAPAAVRSIAGIRLLLWIVAETRRQSIISGSLQVEIVVEDMIKGLCRRIGVNDRAAWPDVRAALLFWGTTSLQLPGGGVVSSLYWVGFDPTRRVIPRGLVIRPYELLFPDFSLTGMGSNKRSDRIVRKRVPAPDITSLPVFGRPADYGKIAMLVLLVLEDLTFHAHELVGGSGAGRRWDGPKWRELARSAGLGDRGADVALAGFQRPDDEGRPAFLINNGGRYLVNHAGPWRHVAESLEELGRRVEDGKNGIPPTRGDAGGLVGARRHRPR